MKPWGWMLVGLFVTGVLAYGMVPDPWKRGLLGLAFVVFGSGYALVTEIDALKKQLREQGERLATLEQSGVSLHLDD